MTGWEKIEVVMADPDGRQVRLQVNYCPGYPAITNRAPEDCDPGAQDEAEILSGMYDDDGRPVPDDVLVRIETEDLIDEIRKGD